MRLTQHTFLTLDGVMQAPGASDEDPDGGFAHGGWSFPYGDEDFGAAVAGRSAHPWRQPAAAARGLPGDHRPLDVRGGAVLPGGRGISGDASLRLAPSA
jgi:hypothetical protein